MSNDDRRKGGLFAPGNKIGRLGGRPPRDYCIAHEMAAIAKQADTIDDQGNTLTGAQIASKWVWDIIKTGLDRRRPASGTGADEVTPVGTQSRLEALKLVLSRIEPDYKLTDRNFNDGEEEKPNGLDKLTPIELGQLETLVVKATTPLPGENE